MELLIFCFCLFVFGLVLFCFSREEWGWGEVDWYTEAKNLNEPKMVNTFWDHLQFTNQPVMGVKDA